MPTRRSRNGKTCYFFFLFFFLYVFWNFVMKILGKLTEQNCANFGKFLSFFYYGFYWKSVFYCKVPFRPHWWAETFLRKKNWSTDSKFLTFLTPINYPFFDFWIPLVFGPKPDFFGISDSFLARKLFSGWSHGGGSSIYSNTPALND